MQLPPDASVPTFWACVRKQTGFHLAGIMTFLFIFLLMAKKGDAPMGSVVVVGLVMMFFFWVPVLITGKFTHRRLTRQAEKRHARGQP